MSVDHEAGMSVWRQVAQIITDRINSGEYPKGKLMPSVRHLAQEFGVADGTVKHALRELKGQRVIATENGRGSWPI